MDHTVVVQTDLDPAWKRFRILHNVDRGVAPYVENRLDRNIDRVLVLGDDDLSPAAHAGAQYGAVGLQIDLGLVDFQVGSQRHAGIGQRGDVANGSEETLARQRIQGDDRRQLPLDFV